MADENKIKTKIELEGEKQYSSAIKSAQRDLRTLRSEMKAETAELGKNATAQQKAEVKAKSLQKQIAAQEKIVKACRDALDEVKKKYGDNEDAVAQYTTKLNSARTVLANMKNELDKTGDEFGDVTEEVKQSNVEVRSFAESLESIGSAGLAISGFLSDTFKGMLGTVKSAATEVWQSVTEVAARANNWTDLASYYGSSAGQIQQWDNAISDAAGSFNDFITLVNMLSFGGKDKNIAELLGLSDVNYSNSIEFTELVLKRLKELKGELSQSAYDDLMGNIFGTKKSQSVNWFVSNLDAVLGGLEKYDAEAGGFGLDDEQLQTMNDLWVKVNGINTMWSAFKSSFLAGAFGELGLELTGDAQGILSALNDFMKAENQEDRDAALQEVKDGLKEFFEDLGTALSEGIRTLDEIGGELQNSEDGTVRMLGTVLSGISDALEWFTQEDNIDKVVTGFKALLAVWAGGEIAGAIGKLAALAANIALVKNAGGIFGMFGKGKAAGDAATAAGSAATAATAAGSAAGTATGVVNAGAISTAIANFLTSWKGVAGSAVLYGVPMWDRLKEANRKKDAENQAIMDMAAEAAPSVTRNTREQNQRGLRLLLAGLVNDQGTIDEITQEAAPAVSPIREGNGQELNLTEQQRQAAEIFWDAFRDDQDFSDDEWNAYEGAFKGFEGLFDELETRINNFIQRTPDDSWRSYEDIPAEIFSEIGGMNGASQSLDNASNTLKGLPALMAAAVRNGVSNIVVTIDGQKAGSLLAPYVSQSVAREIV